ncbi:MAG: LysR family transcriptional regulator [Paracoccaceae bacterium]
MAYLDSIRVFVRVVDLGSITAGGRDLRLSPAVASNRIKALEDRLGIRLFNRTTRRLTPTEAGRQYYDHARRILDALGDAEAMVAGFSNKPNGEIRVTAPLGIGRRIIAPLVPAFNALYPDIQVRLRLSDRKVDIFAEGVDVAFVLGTLLDSDMKARKISDCPRILCASTAYLKSHGTPVVPSDLTTQKHRCLLLRFPGSAGNSWMLQTEDGLQKVSVSGPYDADEGDVLTDWALAGHGIVNKPLFEVAGHIKSGALVRVLEDTPPPPSRFACLYPHRRLQDPKVRLFVDYMITQCRNRVVQMNG